MTKAITPSLYKYWIYMVCMLCLAFGPYKALAQSVTGNATTAGQDGSQTDTFININNATGSSDATSATCSGLDDGEISEHLLLTGFGFSIPGTDAIDGVSVSVRGVVSHNSLRIQTVRLIDETSTIVGNDNASDTPIGTSIATVAFGGSTDDWGLGGSLDQTMVESANFGVALQLGKGSNAGGERTGDIYWVEVTVYHSPASTGSFSSVQTGDWDDCNTWNTCPGSVAGTDYPADDYDAEINGGHTITIPASFSAACEKLLINADADDTNPATLTFTNSTSSLTVDGNASMVKPTTHTADAINVINMNGGTMTVNGSLFIEADRLPGGGNVLWEADLDVGGGTLTVAGDINFTSDNANADAELDISTAGSSLVIGGGFIEVGTTGTGQLLTMGTDCTVEYNASGAQTIEGQIGNTTITYDNLTLSSSGAKTLAENATVNGTLSLQGTATFADGGNTLTYGTTSTLEYSGSSAQTAGDEMDAVGNVQTLVVNNSNDLNLSASETIDDAITLTNGSIILGANNLTLASGGSITGFDNTNYIVTNSSGYYEQTTSGATTYPIGTTSFYNPAVITPTSDAAFQVSVGSGPNNSPQDPDRTVQLEWQVNTSGSPGATTVQFEWDQSQEGSDFQANDATVVVGHYTGGNWVESTASYAEDSPTAGRSQASAGGYSSFSPFAVGAGDQPLPIELKEFSAQHHGDRVEVHWLTSIEINNDYFTLERSEDGQHWHEWRIVEGAGTTTQEQSYTEIDRLPLVGVSYYRLKQTDFDGAYEYFDMVKVSSPAPIKHELLIYPSVVNAGEPIHVSIGSEQEEDLLVTIHNQQGITVYSTWLSAQKVKGNMSIETDYLKSGLYLIRLSTTNQVSTQRIFVN